MQPPIIGTWQVRILDASPFTIHSDEYFALSIERTDSVEPGDTPMNVRVPLHAFSAPPQVGQRVKLTFLMGQVTKVEPVL